MTDPHRPEVQTPRDSPDDPPLGPDGSGRPLSTDLKQRHLNLIALGGVIGAGLFVGSGVVIRSAGPAAILSFAAAGLITVFVMRMLAEMAVERPALGSFYAYARDAFGSRAGFIVGWLYWYFFAIVVAVEAIAGARIMHSWWPSVPLWAWGFGLLIALTATNLISTRSYGEFEYWFSSIKVVAIVLFLGLGAAWILGLLPHRAGGVSGLWSHGGFAPNGWLAVLVAVVPCVAFYTGGEIVTIAAAESANPREAVKRSMRTIVWRVVLFYVGSVFVVVATTRWSSPQVEQSPYAATLRAAGLPNVGLIMDVLILTAVLSCLNSALYTCSRMLFALSQNGDAPGWLGQASTSGVPRAAILAGTAVGWVSVLVAVISPDTVFPFLLNSYGAVALFVYIGVALSHLRLRTQASRTPVVAMWLFPWLSWATIAALIAIVIAMVLLGDTRAQVLTSLGSLALVALMAQVRYRRARPAIATSNPSDAPGR